MALFSSLRRALGLSNQECRKKSDRSLRRFLNVETLEDRMAPAGDILLTAAGPNSTNVFQEYTQTGTLVRTVTVPPPPSDSFTYVASIAQDPNGNVYVYDGRSALSLAIYHAQTGGWSQLTYAGWTVNYQSGDSGLALYSHYAYVNEETESADGTPGGVIRFDLNTGVGAKFDPFNSDTVSVDLGLDGNFYALGNNQVFELDPNTMALENTVNLPNDHYVGIAVDAAGDINTASQDGTVNRFDPSGNLLASTTVSGRPESIAMASDGTLALDIYNGSIVEMTDTLTNRTSINASGNRAAFAEAPPPGPASPAQTIVACSATTLQSGTMTAAVTLTAIDANGFRENSGGLAVQFGVAGTAQGAFSSVNDNGDGTYTAAFTATAPGSATITATIGGQAVTSTLPSLTISPSTAAGNILLTAQPQSGPNVFEELTHAGAVLRSVPIPANLGGAGNLAADSVGDVYISHGTSSIGAVADFNAAAGTWSALTSNAFGAFDGGVAVDGNYVYSGSNGAGSGGVIRWDRTTGVGTDFDASEGNVSDVTLGLDGYLYGLGAQTVEKFDPVTMNLLNTIPLSYLNYTGIAINAAGDIYATEYSLNVDEFNPAGVLINQVQAPADVGQLLQLTNGPDGSLLMVGRSGNVVRMSGALTVISDFAVGGTIGVAFAPAPIGAASPATSFVTVNPTPIPLGTATTITLAARDSLGNGETSGGLSVTFGLGAGPALGTFGPVTDNGDGTYTATFTAGALAGANTITATINGQPLTTTAPSLTVLPYGLLSAAQSTVSISTSQVPAGTTAVVTLQEKDTFGNDLTTGGQNVAFALSTGSGSGTFGPVYDNGNGTYSAVFAATTLGSNTITATINGQAVTSQLPTVSVEPGPVSLAFSAVTLSSNSIAAGSTTTVTLTTFDGGGNLSFSPATGNPPTVVFSFASGSIATGNFTSVFNVHGSCVYTAILTGITAGAGGVTASINGQPLASTPAPLTVTAPAPDHFKVAVGNTSVAVTAQDAFNNISPSYAGSVHLDSVNNASAPINYSFSPVADAGQHVFSLSTASGVTVTNLTTLSGSPPANVGVQADIALAAGQYAGLVTHYSGPTDKNMYFGGIIPNPSGPGFVAGIWINNASGWKLLTSYVHLTLARGTLYFQAVGSSLQLYFQTAGSSSFALLTSANDSSLTGGTFGVRMARGVTMNNIRATAIATANATLPYSENFGAANYPTTFASGISDFWQNQTGNVVIANATAVGQTPLNVATLNGVNQANVTVQTAINVHAGTFAGLVSRYTGTGDRNMYFAGITSSGSGYSAAIWINLNGVWTRLTPLTSVGHTGQGTLKFKTVGSLLQLFWNGTLIVSVTDTRLTTGSVGMRIGQGSTLANFSAS